MQVASFVDGPRGRLFCSGFRQSRSSAAQRSFLLIPPFAEEMNKSRHVLAAMARALGDAGHEVLLPDLYGTGDSEGDFGDATIDVWRGDLDAVAAQFGAERPLDIIGLRFGALLGADLAKRRPTRSLVLLHPLGDGRQQVTQMLRLRLAAGLMGGSERETAAVLRERLAGGETLEIAGYRISAEMVDGMESLQLADMVPSGLQRLAWLELAAQADRPLMPVSTRIIEAWEKAGVTVTTRVVACDAFWSTQEIAYCPEIVREATAWSLGD